MEAGERSEALKHADAALALDPAFLAAQTLRERIVAMSAAPVRAVAAAPVATAVLADTPSFLPPQHATAPAPEPAPPRRQPLDLAQFEARARQRRVERRVVDSRGLGGRFTRRLEVNEQALQRAFQALESQTLTFDACDVQLRGSSATATCRGSTQYVPKFGSREPRIEPRLWNFTLQKFGETWQIASARTQR